MIMLIIFVITLAKDKIQANLNNGPGVFAPPLPSLIPQQTSKQTRRQGTNTSTQLLPDKGS